MLDYDLWLLAIFDHSEIGWYFGPEETPELWELEKDPEIVVELVTKTFQECASLPESFTDQQIADGINYIINNSCSDLSFSIYNIDNGVPLEARLKCLEAVYTVYKDLFAVRCSPRMGHTLYNDKIVTSPLNYPCYMWWDITPIYGHPDNSRYEQLDRTILNVMAKTLSIDSAVCCEGALHGLGHWSIYYRKEVGEIIDSFLAEKREVVQVVRGYAEAAKRGQVM